MGMALFVHILLEPFLCFVGERNEDEGDKLLSLTDGSKGVASSRLQGTLPILSLCEAYEKMCWQAPELLTAAPDACWQAGALAAIAEYSPLSHSDTFSYQRIAVVSPMGALFHRFEKLHDYPAQFAYTAKEALGSQNVERRMVIFLKQHSCDIEPGVRDAIELVNAAEPSEKARTFHTFCIAGHSAQRCNTLKEESRHTWVAGASKGGVKGCEPKAAPQVAAKVFLAGVAQAHMKVGKRCGIMPNRRKVIKLSLKALRLGRSFNLKARLRETGWTRFLAEGHHSVSKAAGKMWKDLPVDKANRLREDAEVSRLRCSVQKATEEARRLRHCVRTPWSGGLFSFFLSFIMALP